MKKEFKSLQIIFGYFFNCHLNQKLLEINEYLQFSLITMDTLRHLKLFKSHKNFPRNVKGITIWYSLLLLLLTDYFCPLELNNNLLLNTLMPKPHFLRRPNNLPKVVTRIYHPTKLDYVCLF